MDDAGTSEDQYRAIATYDECDGTRLSLFRTEVSGAPDYCVYMDTDVGSLTYRSSAMSKLYAVVVSSMIYKVHVGISSGEVAYVSTIELWDGASLSLVCLAVRHD